MIKFLALFFVSIALSSSVSAQVSCSRTPEFATKLGYSAPVISTTDRMRGGMVFFKKSPEGSLVEPYQHPSWKQAGRLGGFVVTERGEIFVVPVPNVNTLENPPGKQNILQRVDPLTGEMGEFLTLPVVLEPSQKNPYGLVGIAYDCKRRMIYLTTLSGSSPDKQTGRIFAIRIDDRRIVAVQDGIDAIGIGVFEDQSRHFAVFGSARESILRVIELADTGEFKAVLPEILRFDPLNTLRARKIRFSGEIALVEATEFYYNLVAQTEFESVTLQVPLSKFFQAK